MTTPAASLTATAMHRAGSRPRFDVRAPIIAVETAITTMPTMYGSGDAARHPTGNGGVDRVQSVGPARRSRPRCRLSRLTRDHSMGLRRSGPAPSRTGALDPRRGVMPGRRPRRLRTGGNHAPPGPPPGWLARHAPARRPGDDRPAVSDTARRPRPSPPSRRPRLDQELERRPQCLHLDQTADQTLASLGRLLERINGEGHEL